MADAGARRLGTAMLVTVVLAWGLTWPVLYSSIPGTALAYWAVAMAGRLLPAVTTSLGLLATPVVSIVVAGVWLGEAPTASLLVGVALILGGVAIGATAEPDA